MLGGVAEEILKPCIDKIHNQEPNSAKTSTRNKAI